MCEQFRSSSCKLQKRHSLSFRRRVVFYAPKSARRVIGMSILYAWQKEKTLIRYLSRRKNQKLFSQLFQKMWIFKSVFEKNMLQKVPKKARFSTDCIGNVEKRYQKRACRIQFGELEKSRKKSEKKCWQIEKVLVLCKGTRESGPEKPLDDRAHKALCKLNNDHENKEPWQ